MHRLQPTRSVLDIAERLESAGFEAWCVGGAIRDALLGGTPLDWDLATPATPAEVQRLFGKGRTIPVGLEFGTVSVLDDAGVAHEITTFRRDVDTDGRHAVVEFGASLDDDLSRRDLTINAIAFRPKTGELRDPFNGRADLDAGVVRAVGDPELRMREDRLRALRAIRFASRFGFQLDPATFAAIRASAPFLTRLSAERVQQELVKTMEQVQRPGAALRLWRDMGALAVLVPSLGTLDDVSLDTLDRLPTADAGGRARSQRTSNRIAALFLGRSAAETRATLTTLRFSRHETAWAAAMADRWLGVGRDIEHQLSGREAPSDVQARRWLAALGRLHAGAFLRITGARWSAMRDHGESAPAAAAVRALHKQMARRRYAEAIEVADLAVGGDDLRRAGIPPGPIYAKILQSLLEFVLDEPSRNTPAALLAALPSVLATVRSAVDARR